MRVLTSLMTAATVIGLYVTVAPAHAITPLSHSTINQAVEYGLENQDLGLSSFLGSNWREGNDGALLNIYTPFMEIARHASHKKFPNRPTEDDVAAARKTLTEDIFYIWTHPTVKMMVSMYGTTPNFGKEYFAVIEGVGKGRSFTIYPSTSIPQYLATKEKNVTYKPFNAINAYHFKYEDLAPLDEFTLKLYGKNVEPITFKMMSKDIQ
jgi:hypothetical protein